MSTELVQWGQINDEMEEDEDACEQLQPLKEWWEKEKDNRDRSHSLCFIPDQTVQGAVKTSLVLEKVTEVAAKPWKVPVHQVQEVDVLMEMLGVEFRYKDYLEF